MKPYNLVREHAQTKLKPTFKYMLRAMLFRN